MTRALIRWAKTTLARAGGSASQFPTQQVTYMGKVARVVPWLPYGFAANTPPGKLAVALSILGNSDSTVVLPGSPGEEPVALAEGETALYHPETGSRVHMQADGSINVVAGTASALLTAAGGITITPGATPLTIAGDAVVTGTLTVSGASATLPSVVTSGVKSIGDTHTHGAGSYLDSLSGAVTGTGGTPT